MAQNRATGARGVANGYRNADELATLLGATRLDPVANVFRLGGRLIALKTGDRGLVIPDGLLSRVDAVLYGYRETSAWAVFEVSPATIRRESSPSQSKSHQTVEFKGTHDGLTTACAPAASPCAPGSNGGRVDPRTGTVALVLCYA